MKEVFVVGMCDDEGKVDIWEICTSEQLAEKSRSRANEEIAGDCQGHCEIIRYPIKGG